MLAIIHFGIVILTGMVVLYSDEQALQWVLGRKRILNKARIAFLHRSVSVGLVLILVTGGFLYLRAVPAYLTSPTFIVKMVAVGALVLNTYFIEKFSHVATSQTFASLPKSKRLPLFLTGGISVMGWGLALLCGLILS
ncbi:hypothetical protein BH11PAT2_BH11PAT2_08790 [soil metagenome]